MRVGKQGIKKIVLIVMFLVLAGYIAYAMIAFSATDPETVCAGVNINVNGSKSSSFISKNQVENILAEKNLLPQGRPLADVDTKRIEETLRHNPFVERVECYKTPTGNVSIDVFQRVPIIYVLPTGKDGYFIDSEGEIIPNEGYAENIVVATGSIDMAYAKDKLFAFAEFLSNNEFWNSQIEQIDVAKDGKKTVVHLVPRVGNHIVFLGEVDNFKKKLNRLKIFYKEGLNEVGWNKYSLIDVQYDNQIICKKNKGR
jgi:cell division protein FtsQ